MSTTTRDDSNIVADLIGGIFTLTGKTIGVTASTAYDVVSGTVEGVLTLPGAIVDGFEKGFTFEEEGQKVETEPVKQVKKEECKKEDTTISIEEYKAKLEAELERVNQKFQGKEVEVKL